MSTDTETIGEVTTQPATVTTAQGYYQQPKRKVYFAGSAYDWKCHTHFAHSLIIAGAECHAQLMPDWGQGDAAIGRKRNFQLWRFLKQTDADFILYADSDLIFTPQDIDRLVSHNVDIIGGLYPKKCPKLEWCYNLMPGIREPDKANKMQVRHAGNGFLLVSRKAAQTMVDYFSKKLGGSFEYRGDPDPETRWDCFPFGAVNYEYKSEDWYFCERAAECGLTVYVDVTVQLRHIGQFIFPLVHTLNDEDVVDLLHHKYDTPKDTARAWLKTQPTPMKEPTDPQAKPETKQDGAK